MHRREVAVLAAGDLVLVPLAATVLAAGAVVLVVVGTGLLFAATRTLKASGPRPGPMS